MNMAARQFSLFAISVVLAGCTMRNVALEPDDADALNDRSVIVVKRSAPQFFVANKGDDWALLGSAAFGLIPMYATAAVVAATELHRGDVVVEGNVIIDPAYAIVAELGKVFGPEHGATFAGLTADVFKGHNEEKIAATLKGSAAFALDVWTAVWGVRDSIFDAGAHKLIYQGRLQLIDLRSEQVVAQGLCSYITPEDASKSYDEFIDDDAAILRLEIKAAVKSCAAEFTSNILRETKDADDAPEGG